MAAETGGAVARGVAWMLLARVADRVGGILCIAITARFLTPTDFGMFQMALSVMALVELFALFGFDWALIRHPNPQRVHFDTAFTLQLIVGVAGCLVVIALAYPFAAAYRTPALVEPIMVMSLLPLVTGFNNLAIAHLRREMRFEADFWRMLVPRIASMVAGIVLAIWWQSYWALIAGGFVLRAAFVVMGYVLHSYRPRLSLAAWRELMGFSMWMQLNNFIEGLRLRVGDLIVGRALGSHQLAVYNMSNEVASLPISEFVGGVNSAVFPKYAKLQDELEQLKAAYLDILSLTLLIGLPIACGLAMVAPSAVRVLLGPNWGEAVPLIQIVAFGALANAVASNSGFVLMAADKPRLNTWLSGLTLLLLVYLLLFLTHKHGLVGASWAFATAAFLSLPLHFLVLRRIVGIRLREIVRGGWRSIAAAVVMAAALAPIVPDSLPPNFTAAFTALTLDMTVGVLVYFATVGVLWVLSGRPDSIERLIFLTLVDITTRTAQRIGGWRIVPRMSGERRGQTPLP